MKAAALSCAGYWPHVSAAHKLSRSMFGRLFLSITLTVVPCDCCYQAFALRTGSFSENLPESVSPTD